MVLYVSPVRGGKAEKTNWVMHQYHLGTGEDEKEGEYVISKVFYQQQEGKQTDKFEQDLLDGTDVMIAKVDPVTPPSVTPDPPRTEKRLSCTDPNALVKSTSSLASWLCVLFPLCTENISYCIESEVEVALAFMVIKIAIWIQV